MSRRTLQWTTFAAVAVLAVLAVVWWQRPDAAPRPVEVALRMIPFEGGAEAPNAELSALAWYGDTLVLMPQYPQRFGTNGDGALFAIERSAIEAFLDGDLEGPLRVRHITLHTTGIEDALVGFDGFEALAFVDGDAYFAVETHPDPHRTVGYLLRAAVGDGLSEVVIDSSRSAPMIAQTDVANTAYEAIAVSRDRILALYEINGDINPDPHVLAFDRALNPLGQLPLSPLEYRLTDATTIDETGAFWVANYHWPGSPWQPSACRLTERYGEGESHARCQTVERLVELRATRERVELTDRPPILFSLVDDNHARNWEGVVRLPGRGFLVVTDEHPNSMLAFVPHVP